MPLRSYFHFRDRKGDTFRWKGENVSTAEVEAVISRVTGLSDVVVYGVTVAGCEGRAGMATLAQNSQSPLDMDSLAKDITTKLPVYARPYFLRLTEKLDITGTVFDTITFLGNGLLKVVEINN